MFISMSWWSIVALLTSTASAQFVPAPTDLITKKGYAGIDVRYKAVPQGICELDPNVKSFAGYADVDENQHIFWWFFEARNQDPTEAPLTVWINGGPGSTSMIGLFQEMGPCYVDINGEVVDNPYSWSNASNMLFIDQPTTVGFSYSIPVPGYVEEGYLIQLPNATCPDYAKELGTCGTYSKADLSLTANTTESAAPNMWKTLQGFMGVFPEYSRSGFSFATESYGGHWAPVFNEYILEQNRKNIPGAHVIELENVLIGNGWFDPLSQYQAYYNFSIYPGNTYDITFNESVAAEWYNNLYGEGNCVDQTKQCYATGENAICAQADLFCANKVEFMFDVYSGRDEYDIRELTPDPFPYSYYEQYLNSAKVQQAIGAFQNFSMASLAVGSTFANTGDDDRESGSIEACQKLLEAGVQVTLYFGDADYVCNWLGGEVVADLIGAPGYSTSGYVDMSTSDGIVHGQVKQSELFSFVRIYESGHEVPFYQPLASLEMFERALGQVDIATGKDKVRKGSGYRTVGTAKSEYRQGNSTVQFEVLAANATYNTKLNAPDAVPTWAPATNSSIIGKRSKSPLSTKKRSMGKPGRRIKARRGN